MATRRPEGAFWTKVAACADRNLGSDPFRLLCALLDRRQDVRLHPDDEFSMPWPEIRSWLGWSRNTTYRHIARLVSAGYLDKKPAKGSPPESQFRIRFKVPKNGHFEVPKPGHHEVPKNGHSLAKCSLREGMGERITEGMAPAGGEERTRSVRELGAELARLLGE